MNLIELALVLDLYCLLATLSSARTSATTSKRANEAKDRKQAPRASQDTPYYFQAERLLQRDIKPPGFSPIITEARSGPEQKKQEAKRHIRLVTVEAPPFMMKRELSSDEPDYMDQDDSEENDQDSRSSNNNTGNTKSQVEWHGYCMDFFQELLKYLPYELSYEIYEAPDRKYGSKTREVLLETTNNNKSAPVRREYWNGMIGELASGRAQLALAPLAVMAERELVVDFTVPFYDLVGIQILLKRPEVPRDWFKFLTVLDNEVWLSITLAYFVTSLIIYLFDRLSPYSHKNMKRVERIRARRRERMAREAERNRSQAGANGWPSEPTNASNAGPRLSMRPLSKLHEPFGAAAPSSVVYPLMPGGTGGIRAISGLVEMQQTSLGGPGSSINLQSGGDGNSQRRRLSQDYLQSLRKRRSGSVGHHHQESEAGASGFGYSTNQAQQSTNLADDELASNESTDSDQDDDEAGLGGVPDFNLRDSLWFCITSLTPQGGGEAPQNLSGRVVAGAWWLFCFIVIASYTANLAAFLTVSRLDIPIESLDDLAKQYRIKYAPIEGTAEQSFFERMAYIEEIFYNIWKEMSLNDSLSEEERSRFAVWDYPISDKYTKIWAQIQEVQMPTSLSQAIERVKASTLDDGFALLASANVIRYATMTDCSFRAVGEEFSRKPIALALQKGQAGLRDDLSYAILQLINKRYMEVLREKWWTNNPGRVICDLNDESEGISIENIGGVFIIILAGALLSFLVWAAERLVYRTKLDVSRGLLEMGQSQQGGRSERQRTESRP